MARKRTTKKRETPVARASRLARRLTGILTELSAQMDNPKSRQRMSEAVKLGAEIAAVCCPR